MEVDLGGRTEVEPTCELDSWEEGTETRDGARSGGGGGGVHGGSRAAASRWGLERGERGMVGGGLERGEKEEDDDIIYMWSSLRAG